MAILKLETYTPAAKICSTSLLSVSSFLMPIAGNDLRLVQKSGLLLLTSICQAVECMQGLVFARMR